MEQTFKPGDKIKVKDNVSTHELSALGINQPDIIKKTILTVDSTYTNGVDGVFAGGKAIPARMLELTN